MKTKPLRSLADVAASAYIALCFLRRFIRRPVVEQTIVFSRGAFRRDLSSIGRGSPPVVIHGEWLRRFFRAGVPDGCLEQVICLSYRPQLRAAFPLALRTFIHFANQAKSRIVFGGVDYFEVTIFAQHEYYREGTSIESVYHENYAIDYVRNLNFAFYQTIQNRFLFDRLYTYGPPATRILANYTVESRGPRPMVMPRLARMEDDAAFAPRLASIDQRSFASTVLLLAFPGTEYLAPLCFTATLLALAKMGRDRGFSAMVKFKSPRAARPYIKQIAPLNRHIRWIGEGSVETLVWQAGFTVVFNSISLYEALLGPTVVIIPSYMDAMHDPNLLQETPATISSLCGELRSVRFAQDLADLGAIIEHLANEDLAALAAAERQARKALVSRKFYLTGNVDTAEPNATVT